MVTDAGTSKKLLHKEKHRLTYASMDIDRKAELLARSQDRYHLSLMDSAPSDVFLTGKYSTYICFFCTYLKVV